MKDKMVKVVRRVVPKRGVKGIETLYRKGRVVALTAKYGYPARDLRVIAVTGTNGKTTTANYLNEILKAAGYATAMFSTAVIEVAGEQVVNDLNATVALTEEMQRFFRRSRKAGVDFVVLEITSHALDQHKLDLVPIECAIMTNLTHDHLDYHGTMERYAAAKGRLFARKPRFIVLNRDDKWFDFFDTYEAGEQKMTYGATADSECRITGVTMYKKGTEVSLELDHQTHIDLATALPGRFNVYNLTAAATAAYLLHVPIKAIVEGVANLLAVPGRLERIEVGQSYDVIVDYAHTPDALQQVLDTARQLTKNRVILVFGATGDRDKGKRPIMGEIAAKVADRIFLTDEESYNEDPAGIRQMVMEGITIGKGVNKTEEIADRREAIAKALQIARRGDIVMITGMGHEQFRIVNGEKLPWSDGDVVRETLNPKI